MSSNRQPMAMRLSAILAVALLAGACANPRPAPVVNRTGLPVPIPEGQPPLATLPGQPLPPAGLPAPLPPGQAGQPSAASPGGVEVSPIRGGGIEPGSISTAPGPVDPNLKTGPKGFKRPYGEMAAVDPRVAAGGSAPGAAAPAIAAPVPAAPAPVAVAPAVVTTTAPPSAMTPPVSPPAPASPVPAGGTGMLEGVAFAWPAAGSVLQNFDETSSKGLSLGGKAGDIVRSAADGRVIFSGAGPRGYGNLIIVKHDNELLSVYAHNRSLAVKEGDTIKRGQKIAELGSSGTDKPKLHFEIRQQGKPIDPLAVLPKR